MDSEGFKRFKARRAAKTTEDADYAMFTDTMSGKHAERMAGVPTTGTPGGADPSEGVSDATIYQAYMDQLSGRADRRRAEQMVKTELQERESEIVRYAKITDSAALSRSHEHLRARIPGGGRPFEGS